MSFGTVAILGPGLIGGSIALALAERGLAERLFIYARSARALDAIRTAGVEAELTDNPGEAVREADVVILCVPIEAMAGLVDEIGDQIKPGALVTDVGSVKGSVERELAPRLAGKALWIGSHPMAGSEQAGFAAARADLFEKAAVILTPTGRTQPQAIERAGAFWQALGGRLVRLSPAEHDQAVASISHLPHLMASILVNLAASERTLDLAGGGFRDTTRIASGSPELWTEILLGNASAVVTEIERLATQLQAFKALLERGGADARAKATLLAQLQEARSHRAKLPGDQPFLSSRS